MKIMCFWDVAPYSLVDMQRYFRLTCCLCDQGTPEIEAADSVANAGKISVILHGVSFQDTSFIVATARK